jgi:hypothetical protein
MKEGRRVDEGKNEEACRRGEGVKESGEGK